MSRKPGDTIVFNDFPEFTPNLTPVEIFKLGAFGGTYWRPITSGVLEPPHNKLKDQHLEFPEIAELGDKILTLSKCNPKINYHKIKAGSSLDDWETKGWIMEQDPYGWVQWYCRFYYGRRSDDDDRQIDRWVKYAGPMGRWKRNIENQIANKGIENASKKIRQGLLQWAYFI